MGFWKRAGETKLEHELRAQRPQPRDEFVRMLSRQVAPVQRRRRPTVPKVALVAAVTAALATSLGAAGALGAAGGSVHAFSNSVVHLVSPPKAATPAHSGGSTTASSRINNEVATPTDHPFQHQYGHLIPICWQGHIIYVTPRELIYYFFHGGRPAVFCTGHPHG